MKRTRRQYSTSYKREAIELAATVGPAEAERQLGMPGSTLAVWVRRSKDAKEAGEEWPPLPASEPDEDATDEELQEAFEQRDEERKPKQVARQYTPTERAEALEKAAQDGVTAAHKELGMSRHTIYEWRRKQRLAQEGKGPSPTSGPDPADVKERRDREILKTWKEHPGLGPSQIRNQLRRDGIKVSVGTARKVMEDAGYRPPKPRVTEHDKRFEAVRPNHLWHLDFVQRWIGRVKVSMLIILDDHSRFVVGHGTDDAERADLVIGAFEAAVARHGRPEHVIHDKGSTFWSWKGISRFTALLEEMEVGQIVAEHKEWNGKLENFNGNLQTELFDQHRFYDVNEMQRRLANHLRWYHHRRTHHALGGLLVPADRYFGRSDEVLARIESGAGAEELDPLGLRDRSLELFKVVSRGGKPEVWLLGQPLLGAPS